MSYTSHSLWGDVRTPNATKHFPPGDSLYVAKCHLSSPGALGQDTSLRCIVNHVTAGPRNMAQLSRGWQDVKMRWQKFVPLSKADRAYSQNTGGVPSVKCLLELLTTLTSLNCFNFRTFPEGNFLWNLISSFCTKSYCTHEIFRWVTSQCSWRLPLSTGSHSNF